MTDYRVKTDIYNGPLDLLLYLIRREEVDIYDIPIARITGQYCEYVELLKVIDPNVAGEFLVMAATLMEIKSRMLLPRAAPAESAEDDLGDPRLELVRQLLEYKKFKDASLELSEAAQRHAQRWPRVPAKLPRPEPGEVDLEDVQIWDLVAAFNKLMAAIGAGAVTHDVIFDDTPIALHAADILDRLQRESGELNFTDIFLGRSKSEMIGLFLALLELMRQHRVRISQPGVFAPIQVILISAEPIQIGHEWESAIREVALGAEPAAEAVSQLDAEPSPAPVAAEAAARPDTVGDDPEEAESFAELDQIKTDVDIDAVLREQPAPDGPSPQELSPP